MYTEFLAGYFLKNAHVPHRHTASAHIQRRALPDSEALPESRGGHWMIALQPGWFQRFGYY
jgi:hypothetical protein